jgi:hypothetical protein
MQTLHTRRGGKVAMTFALNPDLPQDMLSNLIVVDVAPSTGDISSEFRGYVEGMKKIDASKVSSRKEAQDILMEYEKVCPNKFRVSDCPRQLALLEGVSSLMAVK